MLGFREQKITGEIISATIYLESSSVEIPLKFNKELGKLELVNDEQHKELIIELLRLQGLNI